MASRFDLYDAGREVYDPGREAKLVSSADIEKIDEFMLAGMREVDALTPAVPPMTPDELRIEVGSKWNLKSNPDLLSYVIEKVSMGRVHTVWCSSYDKVENRNDWGLKFFLEMFQPKVEK